MSSMRIRSIDQVAIQPPAVVLRKGGLQAGVPHKRARVQHRQQPRVEAREPRAIGRGQVGAQRLRQQIGFGARADFVRIIPGHIGGLALRIVQKGRPRVEAAVEFAQGLAGVGGRSVAADPIVLVADRGQGGDLIGRRSA